MYNPVPGVLPNVPASKGYAGGFGVGKHSHLLSRGSHVLIFVLSSVLQVLWRRTWAWRWTSPRR
jgi:hypothetical protein